MTEDFIPNSKPSGSNDELICPTANRLIALNTSAIRLERLIRLEKN